MPSCCFTSACPLSSCCFLHNASWRQNQFEQCSTHLGCRARPMQSRSPAATAKRKQCAGRRLRESINLKDDAPVSQAPGANSKAGDARRHVCQLQCRGTTAKQEPRRHMGQPPRRRTRVHPGSAALAGTKANCNAERPTARQEKRAAPERETRARRLSARAHEWTQEPAGQRRRLMNPRKKPTTRETLCGPKIPSSATGTERGSA